MISFTNEVLINQPIGRVFDFVATVENNPLWNYYLVEVKKMDPEVEGVGVTYFQQRKTDSQTFSITKLEHERLLALKTLPGSKPQVEREMRFLEKEGQTWIHDTMRIKTPLPALIGRWLSKKPKAAVAENLSKLKELLETGSTVLQDGRKVTLDS